MAVRTKEEILELVKTRIGDDESDEALNFVEDIIDTINDYESRIAEDWKAKYEENDKQWRQKYRDRFFNNDPLPNSEVIDTTIASSEEEKPKTYDDLFETVEEK